MAIKSINIKDYLLLNFLINEFAKIEPRAYPMKKMQLNTPSTISKYFSSKLRITCIVFYTASYAVN